MAGVLQRRWRQALLSLIQHAAWLCRTRRPSCLQGVALRALAQCDPLIATCSSIQALQVCSQPDQTPHASSQPSCSSAGLQTAWSTPHTRPARAWWSSHRSLSTNAASQADSTVQRHPEPSETSMQSEPPSQPSTVHPSMDELLGIISQPLPLSSQRNYSLNNAVVELNGTYFINPARTLDSTIRALFVIKQVLRSNGHVCIINNNPAFAPLMRYVARHCLNSNVWWHWEPYKPGTLLTQPATMMAAAAQPARAVLSARGLRLSNVHCPEEDVTDRPLPRLTTLDKWRLWGARRTTNTGLRGRHLLRKLMEDENRTARLLLPGAGSQLTAPTLIVVLDLSYGEQIIHDAHEAGIMTASVVNAHSELDRITYPILAAEAHPAYTHFFLNWLLKVVNMPAPPLPEVPAQQQQHLKPKQEEAQKQQ